MNAPQTAPLRCTFLVVHKINSLFKLWSYFTYCSENCHWISSNYRTVIDFKMCFITYQSTPLILLLNQNLLCSLSHHIYWVIPMGKILLNRNRISSTKNSKIQFLFSRNFLKQAWGTSISGPLHFHYLFLDHFCPCVSRAGSLTSFSVFTHSFLFNEASLALFNTTKPSTFPMLFPCWIGIEGEKNVWNEKVKEIKSKGIESSSMWVMEPEKNNDGNNSSEE